MIKQVAIASLVLIAAFTGVTYAQSAAVGEGGSLLDMAKPVWEAIMGGQYWLAAALALVVIVGLVRRYAPGKFGEFVHSDAGGALTTLLMAFGGALATGLAAVGANALTLSMCWMAVKVAVTAAGGYALVKKLVIDPIVRPLIPRCPAWLQSILQLAVFIFDKRTSTAVTEAEQAGSAAVAENPSTGIVGVAGTPTEIK